MKRFFVFLLVVGFVFAGCTQNKIVQPEKPAEQEAVQKAETVEAPKEEKKIEPVKEEAPVAAKEEVIAKETVVAKEETKKAAMPPVKAVEKKSAQSTFENILFDFDKYDIRDDAKPALKSVADWLIKNKDAKMLIEGHCDERGTNEYNLALGERRAKSTRDYLVSSGVKKDRLDMISHGEERPLCKEQTEDCWQKNRRAQFILKGVTK